MDDPMDIDKNERIEYAATEAEQVAFVPHCPECLSANVGEIPSRSFYELRQCGSCGLKYSPIKGLLLRPLSAQPAPPYTGVEIMRMAYEYGFDLWDNGGAV